MAMTDATYITISEACKRVSVSRRTLYYWIQDGRVQAIRTAGGNIRVLESSLWQPLDYTSAARAEASRKLRESRKQGRDDGE